MERRTLLAALGAGVTAPGWLAAPASTTGKGDAGVATSDGHRVDVPGSPVTALTVDAAPDDSPLQHAVTVHGQPSTDAPARITESITNAGDRAHAVRVADETLPHDLADAPAARDGPLTLQPGERVTRTYALDVRGDSGDASPFASRFVVDPGGSPVAYRWGFAVEME